jgi:hypothetical protein
VAPRFRRESAETLQERLNRVVIKCLGSLEQAPQMHPDIMFQLCTRMCNHSSYADDGFSISAGDIEIPSDVEVSTDESLSSD